MLKFKPKKLREDDSIVEVGDVKLDAAETEVVFADEEKDIQVVVSPDPENENSVTVAVLTNSKEDVEESLNILQANGEDAYVIGEIVESENKITIV